MSSRRSIDCVDDCAVVMSSAELSPVELAHSLVQNLAKTSGERKQIFGRREQLPSLSIISFFERYPHSLTHEGKNCVLKEASKIFARMVSCPQRGQAAEREDQDGNGCARIPDINSKGWSRNRDLMKPCRHAKAQRKLRSSVSSLSWRVR